MSGLRSLPSEILDDILEDIVITIGIQKATQLRSVSQAFNAAILQAIVIRRVVDINDPSTPHLWWLMAYPLKGKVALARSYSTDAASNDWLSVIAKVNMALDALTGETDIKLLEQRHESIAEIVNPCYKGVKSITNTDDASWEDQNLLSGAIIIGDLPLVKSLLGGPESLTPAADINGHTPYFGKPLALAAGCGHLEMVRYLLDRGARPDAIHSRWSNSTCPRSNGDDDYDHLKAVTYPFEFGNEHPAMAYSALHAAVLKRCEQIVTLLLLPPYRLSSAKTEYFRAIVSAARVGTPLIQVLFDAIGQSLSDFPKIREEILWEAVRHDQKEVVQMVLENGVDINAYPYRNSRFYSSSLNRAASLGNTSMVRFLLDQGADVNFDGYYSVWSLPIEGAARCGHAEVVDVLVERGADPVVGLLSAARDAQPKVIKFLLDKCPNILQRDEGGVGRRTMALAVVSKNLTAMTMLAEAGVSLNEGYDEPRDLPINVAKMGLGQWVLNHLIALGAQETDDVVCEELFKIVAKGVYVSERTWQWAGKY